MPLFSKRSKENLFTCDERLQKIMNIAIQVYDFSVLCGFRNEEQQHKIFLEGYSKLDWPNSNHNINPSQAVDIVPWFEKAPHIRWEDIESFTELSRIIKAIALALDIRIEWGGDWKTFRDLPHWQLRK